MIPQPADSDSGARHELAAPDLASPTGESLQAWVEAILPMWRCITGEGLRDTLRYIGQSVPIALTEVPTGAPVLDWAIPLEWHVREAYLALPHGTRVVDVADTPLHLVQYSTPTHRRMTLAELRPHLHTLPEHPDWIPYRTDYYSDGWGFCLRQSTLDELASTIGESGELDVVLDADLFEGSLTYGEVVIPGQTKDEILISAHACHPALANDNASSMAVATALARQLEEGPRLHHTVRFLFAPGTIGAIAWLHQNRQRVERIRHGLVLANLGDGGAFTYKRSRRGSLGEQSAVDLVVPQTLKSAGYPVEVRPFDPFGYDERQFGSPGFDLPIGRLTQTPHGEYPEYHTSADNLSLVQPDALADSLAALHRIVQALDAETVTSPKASRVEPPAGAYRSVAPYGEPHLGRRGLYRFPDGEPHPKDLQTAISWVLSFGDGHHTLTDVSDYSGLPPDLVSDAATRLTDAGLLHWI